MDEEIPSWNDKVQGSMKIGEKLNDNQRAELKLLLRRYADIFRDIPGRTHLVERIA